MSLSNRPMEYVSQIPEPISEITKEKDQNTTMWVTQAGEFLWLPTEKQAKEKAKYLMSKLKTKEWWAQKISKFSVGKKDYLCAYIKRDFSKEHDRSDFSNMSLDEMWLGRIEIGLPLMTTDKRERSDTLGERVSQVVQTQMPNGAVEMIPVLGSKGFYSYHEATKENIKKYQEMEGMTMKGLNTQYVWILLDGGRNIGVDDPKTFWNESLESAMQIDRNTKKKLNEQESGKTRPSNLV